MDGEETSAPAEPLTAIGEYLALDLAAGSALAGALHERVESEASLPQLVLTAAGEDGALSRALTPAMNEWLNTRVAHFRAGALAELESDARTIKISKDVDGILVEAVQDQWDRHKAKRTLEVLEKFNREHKGVLEEYERVSSEYNLIRAEEGGRDAKTPNKWLEFGLLIPAVMVPEAMLNFESFRRAPIIQSDAMALGATILVGIGIAAAAYCIGLFIRQINYYTSARDDDGGRKRSGWPFYVWGSSALSVSIGSVAAARYYYILPKIEESIILGHTPPNIVVSIGSLLFGNMICFLVGAIITFFLNDPNPEFADKAERRKKLAEEIKQFSKKEVSEQLDRIAAHVKNEKDGAKRKGDQMAGKMGYAQLRERFSRVMAKDLQVVGVLQSYRSALVAAIKRRRGEVSIDIRDPSTDNSNPMRHISLDGFTAEPLHLSRSQS
jgi:hypothetical protein